MLKTVPDTSKYTYNSSLLIIFIISVSAYPVSTIIHKLPELHWLPELHPILYNIEVIVTSPINEQMVEATRNRWRRRNCRKTTLQ